MSNHMIAGAAAFWDIENFIASNHSHRLFPLDSEITRNRIYNYGHALKQYCSRQKIILLHGCCHAFIHTREWNFVPLEQILKELGFILHISFSDRPQEADSLLKNEMIKLLPSMNNTQNCIKHLFLLSADTDFRHYLRHYRHCGYTTWIIKPPRFRRNLHDGVAHYSGTIDQL